MELREPKVKRSIFSPETVVPYPNSLKGVSNLYGSKSATGKYNGSNVVIDDPEKAVAVYKLGCFGKGSLSRGEPNYALRISKDQNNSSLAYLPNSDAKNEEQQHPQICDESSASLIENMDASEASVQEGETEMDTSEESNCLKEDASEAFKHQETLHLNLEEAYFLCYGLGCLKIVDLFDRKLTILESWELFCESQEDFVQKYVVYHYYRSKGWVVKPGLKFGGDFVLYKWGVNITHASYIVVIEVIKGDGNISEDHQQPITWMKLISLNRMAETAGKEVLICRVIWPEGFLFNDIKSPEDIRKLGIEEVLTRRWVSSQQREQLEKEELE